MEDMNQSPRPPLSEKEKDRRVYERIAERLRQARGEQRFAVTGDQADVAQRWATVKASLEQKLAIALERMERHREKE